MGINSKRKIVVITVILFAAYLFKVLWPGDLAELKAIALSERDSYIQENPTLFRVNLQGPSVDSTWKSGYVTFSWYTILSWNDTAVIKVSVPSANFGCQSVSPSEVSHNDQWYYLYRPFSDPVDLLPRKFAHYVDPAPRYKISNMQESHGHDWIFRIGTDRQLEFLKSGFFTAVEWYDTYSVVEFYQPVAIFNRPNQGDSVPAKFAKLFVSDDLEIVIVPILSTPELLSRLPLHRGKVQEVITP